MLRAVRHRLILDAVRASGPVTVTQLALTTGASDTTIRRDLDELDRAGLLQRVHGGALELDSATAGTLPDTAVPDGDDRPFDVVAGENVPAKEAIARRCADVIEDGETVILDIGTTCQRVAAALHGRHVTVITSSLAVVDELADDDAVDLIILGGILRRRYRSMVGFLTEEAMRSLHADRLILSTSGVAADGSVMDTTGIEIPVKRAMIASSAHVVLVADRDKFPGERGARVCGPESVQTLITSPGMDPGTRAALLTAGVHIIDA